MFRNKFKKIHFVGIGGIGMSGIAEVLAVMTYDVSGSDTQLSSITDRLKNLGVEIFDKHCPEHVEDAEVVVVSSAIAPDNVELIAAKKRGIPIIKRAEMLAELMRLKYGIAVAGAHGKTTTTSLIASILQHADLDPTLVIGGRLKSIRTNAQLGQGDYLVAEADESDGSFLRLMPILAVVTNIDAEHLDHWSGGLPQIISAFVDFVNKIPFYGMGVLCFDDPHIQQMLPLLEKRYVTYGFLPQADFVAQQVTVNDHGLSFDVSKQGKLSGSIEVQLIGRHNVLNVLAAIAVADEIGVSFEDCQIALKNFSGIARRFEQKALVKDILWVDDYGHHPTEILVTLAAAKEHHCRRLIVVFQPHRYTRTRDLLKHFAAAFHHCQTLVLLDIYAAGETEISGINSQMLCQVIQEHGHKDVRYAGSFLEAQQLLQSFVEPGDLVLTLGAGNVYEVGEALIQALQRSSAG